MSEKVKHVPASNFPPPGAPPKQPKKKLTVQVNVTDIDKFKELAGLISDMLKDERINSSIRQEYLNRFLDVNDKHKSNK